MKEFEQIGDHIKKTLLLMMTSLEFIKSIVFLPPTRTRRRVRSSPLRIISFILSNWGIVPYLIIHLSRAKTCIRIGLGFSLMLPSTFNISRWGRSTTISSLKFRVRHYIFIEFGRTLEEPWPENLYWNLELPCPSNLECEKSLSLVLAFFVSLDLSLSLSSCICWACIIKR